ncbi:hypothetical protein GQ457_10G009980 [Hibiscus cannabinus]
MTRASTPFAPAIFFFGGPSLHSARLRVCGKFWQSFPQSRRFVPLVGDVVGKPFLWAPDFEMRDFLMGPVCFCGVGFKDVLHVLRDCPDSSTALRQAGFANSLLSVDQATVVDWLGFAASSLSLSSFALLLSILWGLWRRRNTWVHERSLNPLHLVVKDAVLLCLDYASASASTQVPLPVAVDPPVGPVPVHGPASTVEDSALFAGLEFAIANAWPSALIESDAAVLVNKLHRPTANLSLLGDMLAPSCALLVANAAGLRVGFASRLANIAAHTLASWACHNNDRFSPCTLFFAWKAFIVQCCAFGMGSIGPWALTVSPLGSCQTFGPSAPGDVDSILEVPISSDRADTLVWVDHDSGLYTVRSGYLFLRRPPSPLGPPPRLWKILAKLPTIPKVRSFGWRCGREALPMGSRLRDAGLSDGACSTLVVEDAVLLCLDYVSASASTQVPPPAAADPPSLVVLRRSLFMALLQLWRTLLFCGPRVLFAGLEFAIANAWPSALIESDAAVLPVKRKAPQDQAAPQPPLKKKKVPSTSTATPPVRPPTPEEREEHAIPHANTAASVPKPPAMTATASKRTLTRKDKGKAPVRASPRAPAPEATVELDSDDDHDDDMPDAPPPPAPPMEPTIPRRRIKRKANRNISTADLAAEENVASEAEDDGSSTTPEETLNPNPPSRKARYKRVATKQTPNKTTDPEEREEHAIPHADTAASVPKPPAMTATASKRTLTRKDKGKAPVRASPRAPAPEATVELDSDDDHDDDMPDAPPPPAPPMEPTIPRRRIKRKANRNISTADLAAEENVASEAEDDGSSTTPEETLNPNPPSSKARYKRVATKQTPNELFHTAQPVKRKAPQDQAAPHPPLKKKKVPSTSTATPPVRPPTPEEREEHAIPHADTAASVPKPPAKTATASKRTLTRKDKGKAPVQASPRAPAPEATVELDSDDDHDDDMPDAPPPPAPPMEPTIPRRRIKRKANRNISTADLAAEENVASEAEDDGSSTTPEETLNPNPPSSKARYKREAVARIEKEEMLQHSRKDDEHKDIAALVH